MAAQNNTSEKEYIVVTGGAGYIGSHTVVELINHGYHVIVVDNLVNSSYDAIARMEYLVKQPIPFFDVDIRDSEALTRVFKKYKVKGVIHFAALKAVGESTQIPLDYYDNNIYGTISLLKVMKEQGVKTIVFSSSATVYGDATRFENMIPIPEHCPNDPTNPYGKTKYMIEQMLSDIHQSDGKWRCAILRYFNPIGAHPSGLIGEDPLGIPNNLLPYLAQVAIGRREKLLVFGNDYKSHDGTPIRDYIHVVDLAKGHIAALDYLNGLEASKGLYRAWNLGTGKGLTVFDIYHAFCKAVGRELPYEVAPRRAGDVLDLTANPTRANEELKWKTHFSIEDSCRDLWKWTTENPFGFQNTTYKWSEFGRDPRNRLHTVTVGDVQVAVTNYGASIQSLTYKGQQLVNGFCDFEHYLSPENPLMGATVGRYANRISKGEISVNGKTHKLTVNHKDLTLHGGHHGTHRQFWVGPVVRLEEGKTSLEFLTAERDNQDGFPADLDITVKYIVDQDGVEIELVAQIPETSKEDATVVNLTNHAYFNITSGKTIDGVELKLATKKYLKTDAATEVPTGEILELPSSSVTLTPDVSFDNCFLVEEKDFVCDTRGKPLRVVAEATHPSSDVKLTVSTTEPSFQIYTGDYTNIGPFSKRSGFCVESSRYQDAISHEKWAPQVILQKGDVYGGRMKFGVGQK